MSSPIHNHYHFASPRQTTTTSGSGKLINQSEEASASILLNELSPPPLAAAMFSLQLMADAMNRALHQCTSAQQPKNASMSAIDFRSTHAPSFCYFVIDMQSQPDNDYQYSEYNVESCQNYPNASDKQHLDNNTSETQSTDPTFQRQRSISECSDDSFICFEDDAKSIDSTSFGCAVCNTSDTSAEVSAENQELRKRVRFNLKPEVHVMHTWDYAYRAARKGSWQEIALDRERFQQRINRIAPTLNIILTSNHREKVYNDRFLSIK